MPISNRQLNEPLNPLQSAIGNWKSAIGFLCVTLVVIAGCSGRALVHTVPLGTAKINTQGPLLLHESLEECYFWLNERDELCIAMRKFKHSLFGKLAERELVMSFVLPGAPAAESRDYKMDRSTARVFSRFGIYPQRGGSQNGILTVWDFGEGKLKSRFRFNARQQTYNVLTGWSPAASTMYVGEFTAVQNRRRGDAILKQTEEAGLGREAPTRSPRKTP